MWSQWCCEWAEDTDVMTPPGNIFPLFVKFSTSSPAGSLLLNLLIRDGRVGWKNNHTGSEHRFAFTVHWEEISG